MPRVRKGEVRRAAGFALLAGVGAFVYKMLQSVAETQTGLTGLDPPVHGLRKFPQLLAHVADLQEYRSVHENAYLLLNRAFEAFAEELIQLEEFVTKHDADQTIRSLQVMYVKMCTGLEHVKRMITSENSRPDQSARINLLYDDVFFESDRLYGLAVDMAFANGLLVEQNQRNRTILQRRLKRLEDTKKK